MPSDRLSSVIGLTVGITAAGAGLLVYYIYSSRRRTTGREQTRSSSPSPRRRVVNDKTTGPSAGTDGGAPACQASQLRYELRDVDSRMLAPAEQEELWCRLDLILQCVSELREEVADIRRNLQEVVSQIIKEVRSTIENNQKTARKRRHLVMRERTDSMSSSSIYFTASVGTNSMYDGESEGGYTTANAESDYNGESDYQGDRETDRETDEDETSCATIRTIQQGAEEDEDPLADANLDLNLEVLRSLLSQSDELHSGSSKDKMEGFQLLLGNDFVYEDPEFLWRLARAYKDMYEISEDEEEMRSYIERGREVAEMAVKKNVQNAECHKWFAIFTGLMSQYEAMHGQIKGAYIFKKHIDQAICLKQDDPDCYYLRGRWCYEVSNLGWLERKAAAALYENPPSATVSDALQDFLKAEELSPGFSKSARLYIVKCYKDLENDTAASHWLCLASQMTTVSKEDRKLEEMLQGACDK
ncbi:regulator of microtubule dynamics protein 3 [Erpetoichthys calabaricus]|uniref:Regulator of microtubule dynamics protein 3 n=1 Tax=Erpetoichthys calabaricus TaxID=27687 RepID=A0A8C4TAT4_ERPCA|nr:regulator of microtubule dynamics protein 3 [Erpetoichthys calabaricus]